MSFSRFAAIGVALVAGVTLASCASSQTPLPASGPFGQPIGFPGGSARVHVIQGSPQLNLGSSTADLYIDGKLVFPNFSYLSVTPYIELPVGPHDFKLTQPGTLLPTFLDQVITVKAGQKVAIVAEGDAGYHTTTFGVFLEPVYQTPIGIRAASVFNASPNAGTLDFWYNCANPNGPCLSTGPTGTLIGAGITVGTPAAVATSWKNNVLLKASPTGGYCFGAYPTGSAVIIPEINAATGPPNATWPAASADDPQNPASCVTSVTIAPGTDSNFYVLDAPSTPPRIPANGPSTVLLVPDSNG